MYGSTNEILTIHGRGARASPPYPNPKVVMAPARARRAHSQRKFNIRPFAQRLLENYILFFQTKTKSYQIL